MASLPRYQHSFDLLRLTSNTLSRNNYNCIYCHKCHSQLPQLRSFASSSPSSSSSMHSESNSFTEKLRRRLWETDKPPGRIDPYSPASPLREDVENLEAIEEGYRNSKEAGRKDEEDILSQSKSSTGGSGGSNFRAMRKQMPTDDNVYVPAETIDGLEWLGSPRWKVRRRKVYKEKLKTLPEWGVPLPETESQKFTWTKPEEYSSPEALLKALHRALVEVFTFLSAGQDPLNAVTSQSENPTDWTVAVRIDPSEDKSHAVLTFPNADVRDRILRARNSGIDEETERGDISKAQARVQDSAATAPVEAAENVLEESGEDEIKSAADAADADAVEAASKEAFASSETVKSENELLNENTTSVAENQLAGQTTAPPLIEGVSWGKDWKSISIKDPLIKFALTKRLIQITGLRIADHHLRQCDSANDLYHSMKNTIKGDSKPKLAALLLQDKKTELASLPNVMVSEKRVSKLERDIRTGRHPVIARELKKRGLLNLDSRRKGT